MKSNVLYSFTFETVPSSKSYSQFITDSLSSLSSNRIRYYEIGTLFTSTSTFIMHHNEVMNRTTVSEPFLSDTIFIILIAILTIIILLFCFGLFCLCRRTNKRNISPSFDGATYARLNEHSLEIPIGNIQQRTSQYDNKISYINDTSPLSLQTKSSISHSPLINDRNSLSKAIDLHRTAKYKVRTNEKKLKRKRVNLCCCNSNPTSSARVVRR